LRAVPPRRRHDEPAHERQWRWLALVVAMLLHGVFMLAIWYGMRPPPIATPPDAHVDEVLQVRFITSAPASHAAPPAMQALPPPPKARALPKRPEPVSKSAMTLQLPAPKPAEAVRLYDENGQPLLPAASASAPAPGYVQNLPHGDARIMQHNNPINYQPTRFEDDWGKGNAVDRALQKLVDKTTVKKTIRLPRGVRIHCAISLAALAGGCGSDPPPPPSAKDGDERLSMAPAQPLDGAAHAPKKPDDAACIAMYRAGKPLAWDCPVDTPNRAIDTELRERAAGANHSH
jgi:hypothetical protein